MKRKCQISLVLESISCLRKTDKQGGLSVWRIVCEAVLTCHPYVSERGDLLIKEWKYSFELCVFFKEKFINFTHQPQFHLPLVLPPSNSLQSLPQPINQPLLCKGNASHGEVNKPGTLSWGKTETLPNASKVIKVSSHRNWRPKCQLIHQG